MYVNGDLEINGVVMVTIDQPTLDRIRQIHGSRKIKLDRNGYPSIGGKLIHNLLMQGGEEAARILWIAKGWDGVGPMVIFSRLSLLLF